MPLFWLSFLPKKREASASVSPAPPASPAPSRLSRKLQHAGVDLSSEANPVKRRRTSPVSIDVEYCDEATPDDSEPEEVPRPLSRPKHNRDLPPSPTSPYLWNDRRSTSHPRIGTGRGVYRMHGFEPMQTAPVAPGSDALSGAEDQHPCVYDLGPRRRSVSVEFGALVSSSLALSRDAPQPPLAVAPNHAGRPLRRLRELNDRVHWDIHTYDKYLDEMNVLRDTLSTETVNLVEKTLRERAGRIQKNIDEMVQLKLRADFHGKNSTAGITIPVFRPRAFPTRGHARPVAGYLMDTPATDHRDEDAAIKTEDGGLPYQGHQVLKRTSKRKRTANCQTTLPVSQKRPRSVVDEVGRGFRRLYKMEDLSD